MSVTGKYKPPAEAAAVAEELKALVAAQRSATASGGKLKLTGAKKLDPKVHAALKQLKRFAARPDQLVVLTQQMEELADPQLQRDLYTHLPKTLRPTIDLMLSRAKTPPAWAAAVK